MGQVTSRIMRPLRNFNVDNRANKVLERRQKVADPAPKHATTVDKISKFREEHPEFLQAQMKRDEKLHENLKQLYVTSSGDTAQPQSSKRPLPLTREPPPETELGAMDPAGDVPEGRASLKSVLGFLGQHQENRELFNAVKIAEEHKLNEKDVQNVLTHFKILHLHIPKEMYEENKNLKKIVEEQMKRPVGVSSNFRLPGASKEKKLPEAPNSDDLSHSKT